jgi:ATP-dependent DNA helicase RecG
LAIDLNTPIEYIKGVGPQRAEVMQKELQKFTVEDLLYDFPFRYVDKTKITLIKDIQEDGISVQCLVKLLSFKKVKGKRQFRLVATVKDGSGFMELIWFKGANYIDKYLKEGRTYLIYGKVNIFKGNKSIVHPEMEDATDNNLVKTKSSLEAVYSSTEKLNAKKMDSKFRRSVISSILKELPPHYIEESLPPYLLSKLRLPGKYQSLVNLHLPKNSQDLQAANTRIKFEEIFFLQLRMLLSKSNRKQIVKSFTFSTIGKYFNAFFHNELKFELTNAQKRVIKEIRADLGSGKQMNRLLQGDVGSGKTVVAIMTILMAIDNDMQACLMAPTEILAQQHFAGISIALEAIGIKCELLTGSVKGKRRKAVLEGIQSGEVKVLIGTHALIEPTVIFDNLGLAIIDEQHRFGVMQRSKLWKKSKEFPPHIMVMTATPIPRTLALTLYGDLDVSVIDELPPGRKSVRTIHRREKHRPQIIQFMHSEIKAGRQIYVVFPLIEESEKLDLQNLNTGYEQLLQFFPPPQFNISVVHGRMKAADKEFEMQRFIKKQTQIMVATTVIEVGVNVPNASVMIIENTERFGLSQLHQLRGRVGRGSDQAYCILMSGDKISKEGKKRIDTMVRTNDGFEIAEADLEIRGPGNIEGTQQSGVLDFNLFNIITDNHMIEQTRNLVISILDEDPNLSTAKNIDLKRELSRHQKKFKNLRRIS